MTLVGKDWGPWSPPVWILIPWAEVGERGVSAKSGWGDISVPFYLGAVDTFPAEHSKGCGMGPALPAGLGGKRCPCMGQVALGCSKPWCCGCGGWGVTDGSMCPWGPAAGAGGQQVLHVLPDPSPCIPVGAGATGAGPWYSSHSLQSWVLLSMRPAKPGDCFRGISGIPCSESLA